MRFRHAALLSALAALALAGCSSDGPAAPAADTSDAIAVLQPLGLPATVEDPNWVDVTTADGRNQSVHPDIVEFDTPWHGFTHWHVSTPYPFGDRTFENPSVYVSTKNRDITTPNGIINPVIRGFYDDPDSYNSDPELLYDGATDHLVMAFRQVKGGSNNIFLTDSPDGITWSAPMLAIKEPNHRAVSPTIVPGGTHRHALMFYVDAGTKGCTATSTTLMVRRGANAGVPLMSTRWGSAASTDLQQAGYVVWHIKARYIPSKHEYWAIYAAYPSDGRGCGSDDLFLARSTNGVHWQTYPSPLLRHEDREWTRGALYRSTFLFDSTTDRLRVWLSARGADDEWRIGYASFSYPRLLQRLTRGGGLSRDRSTRTHGKAARAVWTDAP